MLNFATLAFIWENVIMMDSLETVAAFDLEVGDQVKYKTQIVPRVSTLSNSVNYLIFWN